MTRINEMKGLVKQYKDMYTKILLEKKEMRQEVDNIKKQL